MAVKTEPQVRKYGPLEAAESQAMLRRDADARLPLVNDQDRPSVAPMVNQGSSIVPSQVDSGTLAPRVDRRG